MDPMLPQITEEDLLNRDMELVVFKANNDQAKPFVAIFGWPSILFCEQTETFYDELKEVDGPEMFWPLGEGATVKEAVASAMERVNRIPNEYKEKALGRIDYLTGFYFARDHDKCEFHISNLSES